MPERERLLAAAMHEAGARALHVDDDAFLERWRARDAADAVIVAVMPMVVEYVKGVAADAQR